MSIENSLFVDSDNDLDVNTKKKVTKENKSSSRSRCRALNKSKKTKRITMDNLLRNTVNINDVMKDHCVFQLFNHTFDDYMRTNILGSIEKSLFREKEKNFLNCYDSDHLDDLFHVISHHVHVDDKKIKQFFHKHPDIVMSYLEKKNRNRY